MTADDPRDLEYWRAGALVASTALEATIVLLTRLPDRADELAGARARRASAKFWAHHAGAVAQDRSGPRRRIGGTVIEILSDPKAAHCRGVAPALWPPAIDQRQCGAEAVPPPGLSIWPSLALLPSLGSTGQSNLRNPCHCALSSILQAIPNGSKPKQDMTRRGSNSGRYMAALPRCAVGSRFDGVGDQPLHLRRAEARAAAPLSATRTWPEAAPRERPAYPTWFAVLPTAPLSHARPQQSEYPLVRLVSFIINSY